MTLNKLNGKIHKFLKILLVSALISEIILIIYALFGEDLNLSAFLAFQLIFVLIYTMLEINLNINITEWMIKRSLLNLVLLNIIALILFYNFFDNIKIMITQFINSIGKKMCGKDCYVKIDN